MSKELEIQEALKMRDEYYHSFPALLNITKQLTFRYMAFSNRDVNAAHMNRYNRAYHSDEFFKTYDRFNFKGINYLRLYLCLTKLRTDFPVLPRSGEERDRLKKEIQMNLIQWVTGYDMAWDFDLKDTIEREKVEEEDYDRYLKKYKDINVIDGNKYEILPTNDNMKILLKDVMTLGKVLEKYGVGYSVTFSGRRGFHIRIPSEYLHPILQKNWERVALVTKKLSLFYNEIDIDTFGNDLMKLLKLPYSVDGRAPLFNLVLPLTQQQIDTFSLEKMQLRYCIKNIKFVNNDKSARGLIMLGFKDMETQHNNTLKMFEDIEGW